MCLRDFQKLLCITLHQTTLKWNYGIAVIRNGEIMKLACTQCCIVRLSLYFDAETIEKHLMFNTVSENKLCSQ